jgi:hypothetical protein
MRVAGSTPALGAMDSQIDSADFAKALEDAGLENASVSQMRDVSCEILRVEKEISGDRLVQEHRLTDREIMELQTDDALHKRLVHLAETTANKFKEHTTEWHEWGESAVKLDLSSNYDAECLRCGARVSMSDLSSRPMRLSETAVPQPTTKSFQELPDEKIRFTLLGLLKNECDLMCPNSPKGLSG